MNTQLKDLNSLNVSDKMSSKLERLLVGKGHRLDFALDSVTRGLNSELKAELMSLIDNWLNAPSLDVVPFSSADALFRFFFQVPTKHWKDIDNDVTKYTQPKWVSAGAVKGPVICTGLSVRRSSREGGLIDNWDAGSMKEIGVSPNCRTSHACGLTYGTLYIRQTGKIWVDGTNKGPKAVESFVACNKLRHVLW